MEKSIQETLLWNQVICIKKDEISWRKKDILFTFFYKAFNGWALGKILYLIFDADGLK